MRDLAGEGLSQALDSSLSDPMGHSLALPPAARIGDRESSGGLLVGLTVPWGNPKHWKDDSQWNITEWDGSNNERSEGEAVLGWLASAAWRRDGGLELMRA